MKRTKIVTAVVTFIVACVAVVLTGTFTTPVAQSKQLESKLEYFKLVYPVVKDFTPVSVSGNNLVGAYVAEQAGVKKGIIYEISVSGYKDDIVFFVAINKDGSLEKPVYASVNDTPGIGTKIETDTDFTDQFLETDVNDFYLDAITTATISSQAVVDGTQSAVKAFEQMKTLLD